jgi:hypothetical protein
MATQQDLAVVVRDVLRTEGVSGAADGTQPWCQTYVREIVMQVLRAEGVSGAADGTQDWCQKFVREVVAEELARRSGGRP